MPYETMYPRTPLRRKIDCIVSWLPVVVLSALTLRLVWYVYVISTMPENEAGMAIVEDVVFILYNAWWLVLVLTVLTILWVRWAFPFEHRLHRYG